MSAFDDEQWKTSGKMSDLVMEYVSRFIARDFFEAYEKASGADQHDFVPTDFDEKIYKKITAFSRKGKGQNIKAARNILFVAAALVCVSSIVFTLMVLSDSSLRFEIFNTVLSFK